MADILDGFEPFVIGRQGSRAGDRSVGVSKAGKLSMTKAVYDAMGSDFVLLLWDTAGRRLAVKACTVDTPGAYSVRKAPKQNSWFVSLQALLAYYGFKPKRTRRYPVRVNDGVLIVPLGDNLEEV